MLVMGDAGGDLSNESPQLELECLSFLGSLCFCVGVGLGVCSYSCKWHHSAEFRQGIEQDLQSEMVGVQEENVRKRVNKGSAIAGKLCSMQHKTNFCL
jgi:hypothetical protein